jgi:hypothetical protein
MVPTPPCSVACPHPMSPPTDFVPRSSAAPRWRTTRPSSRPCWTEQLPSRPRWSSWSAFRWVRTPRRSDAMPRRLPAALQRTWAHACLCSVWAPGVLPRSRRPSQAVGCRMPRAPLLPPPSAPLSCAGLRCYPRGGREEEGAGGVGAGRVQCGCGGSSGCGCAGPPAAPRPVCGRHQGVSGAPGHAGKGRCVCGCL